MKKFYPILSLLGYALIAQSAASHSSYCSYSEMPATASSFESRPLCGTRPCATESNQSKAFRYNTIEYAKDYVGCATSTMIKTDSAGLNGSKLFAALQFKHDNTAANSILIMYFNSGEPGKEVTCSLINTLRAHSVSDDIGKGTYGAATVTLSGNEIFAAPFRYDMNTAGGKTSHYLFISTAAAYGSNKIEEINNGTWNNRSKLKYLNSRLAQKNMLKIELKDINGNYLGTIKFEGLTSEMMSSIFEHLEKNIGTDEFYKYNQEITE